MIPIALDLALRQIGVVAPRPEQMPAIPAHLLGQSPTAWRPTPGNTEPPF